MCSPFPETDVRGSVDNNFILLKEVLFFTMNHPSQLYLCHAYKSTFMLLFNSSTCGETERTLLSILNRTDQHPHLKCHFLSVAMETACVTLTLGLKSV